MDKEQHILSIADKVKHLGDSVFSLYMLTKDEKVFDTWREISRAEDEIRDMVISQIWGYTE